MTFFTFTDRNDNVHIFDDVAHTMLTAAIDGSGCGWPTEERHRIAAWAMMDHLAEVLAHNEAVDYAAEDLWPLDLHGYQNNAELWADLCAWRADFRFHSPAADTIDRIFAEVRELLQQWVDFAQGCWNHLQEEARAEDKANAGCAA